MLRPDFIERYARLTHAAPHLHLSVQSGSSAVLRRMKRRYNAEQAMTAIEALRTHIPSLQLTCDMIVGFPGESEDDFRETLSFSERAHFLSMHVFAFSARRGTPAASFPDRVPEEEKRKRSTVLSALAHRMTGECLAEALAKGAPLPVLFETVEGGIATGHTPSFLPVSAPTAAAVQGEILTVRPTAVGNGVLLGEIIK